MPRGIQYSPLPTGDGTTNVGLLEASLYMRPKLLLLQISAQSSWSSSNLSSTMDETQGV